MTIGLALTEIAMAAGAYCFWDGGAGNGLWSDPVNWTSETKPSSNDYAILGNQCPDEPQAITLDESVWLERIVCIATNNRHYTISPAGGELIRLNNDYGIYDNRYGEIRSVNLTIDADLEVSAALLRIYGAGVTTLNGDIRPCLLTGRTNTYIEPHTADGLLLRGSNTLTQIMAMDSAKVTLDHYFAAGSGMYRNYSGTNGTLMLRTNALIAGYLGLDQPIWIGIEGTEERDVTLTIGLRLIKYATTGSPVTVLPRGAGCTGHFTIRLLGASANATTGANRLNWILDEHCTLEMANPVGAMYWGQSDLPGSAGWIVGAGRVVCDSAGGVSLYSTNAYTGGTLIRSGTMKMMGESRLPTNGLVTVEAAGVLDGNGFVQVLGGLAGDGTVKFSTTTTAGAATLTQSLAPGLSAGTLTFTGPGTLTLGESAVATFEFDDAEAGHDQVVLTHAAGHLTLAGTLAVIDLGDMGSGDYILFDLNGGTVSGAFDQLVLPQDVAATVAVIDGDVVLRVIKQRGTVLTVR